MSGKARLEGRCWWAGEDPLYVAYHDDEWGLPRRGRSAAVWRYEPKRAARPRTITRESPAAMATSPESIALAKDLKRRGFTFVGPTTVYAFMQAMGLVNDHLQSCPARAKAAAARKAFRVPG